MTENILGRSELVRVRHRSFTGMREAFGWTLEQFVYFGGYPGAASLMEEMLRRNKEIFQALQ